MVLEVNRLMEREANNFYWDRLDMISDPLEAARKMHQDWLNYGTDFVRLYVEDVDGDWLENWGEDD